MEWRVSESVSRGVLWQLGKRRRAEQAQVVWSPVAGWVAEMRVWDATQAVEAVIVSEVRGQEKRACEEQPLRHHGVSVLPARGHSAGATCGCVH